MRFTIVWLSARPTSYGCSRPAAATRRSATVFICH